MSGSLQRSIAISLIVLAIAAGVVNLEFQAFRAQSLNIPESTLLTVEPGTTMAALSEQLVDEDILDRPRYFNWLARWRGVAEKIQAGEYRLSPGLTPDELLNVLVGGEVVVHALTVLEGWTFAQMLAEIRRHPAIEQTLGEADDKEIMRKVGSRDKHPEGRFLPDTYHFPRGTTDVEFLQRAYRALNQRLEQEWTERAKGLPFETPEEALILASIVEKETAVDAERAQVAGVFVRRLQRGMRLQTDPTVIYGMGDKFDGNIRRKDLRTDTPYNTYTRDGLPPTPIALPSAASIHAALHPDDGKALFFVSRGDGSHQFSETLKEHNRAVRRYQLGGRSPSRAGAGK